MTDSQQTLERCDAADPDAAQPGNSFEDACIDLLCKQENLLSHLGEASARRRALDSLDLANKMVVAFLDFAEAHFDTDQLNRIGPRLYEVFQRTKKHEHEVCAQTLQLLRRLVGMGCPSEMEITKTRHQLRKEYIDLYNEFFAICLDRFSLDSVTKKQFQKGVAAFVNELDRKW